MVAPLTTLKPLFAATTPKAISYPYTSAIIIVVFGFLLLIAFHVSLVLSSFENDRRKFAQELALLKEEVQRLKNKED
jgi:hypothetical protein